MLKHCRILAPWLLLLLVASSDPVWATLTQAKFNNNTVPIIMKDSAYPGGHYPIVMAMNLDGTAIGGGGGGGAMTVADGADVALGSTTDAAATQGSTGSVSAKLRTLTAQLNTNNTLLAGGLPAALSSGGGIKVGVVDALPTGTNTIGATQDAGPAWTSVFGVAGVPFTSADQHSAVASVTDAPTSGQKLVITDLIVSVDTAMSVTFKEETSGTVIFGPWYCSANSGPMQITLRSKKKLPTADKKLQVITSVAGNITVSAGYFSEP